MFRAGTADARAIRARRSSVPHPAAAERLSARAAMRRDATYRRLLAVADVSAAALALMLATEILGDDRLRPGLLLGLPLVVLVAKLQGLYDRDGLLLNKTTLDEAPKLFQAATLYTLLVSLGDGWLIEGQLGVMQTVGLWGTLFTTAVVGRAAARTVARGATATERVLVLGTADDTLRLAGKLADTSRIDAEVVGRITLEPEFETSAGETLGSLSALEEVVADHRVDRVIVAPRGSGSDHVLDAVRAAKTVGVQVSVLPRMLEVVGSSVEFDYLNGATVLGIRRFGLSRSSRLIKRALDLAGALTAAVLFAPVMAVIAVAIKRSSAGPVLFRQERVGRDGQRFEVLKFRTMVAGADTQKDGLRALNEADGLFKIAEDPRVTGIGRLLRCTSLDELPQLVNVLRGDMSLVGPRPLIPEEDERIEGRHRRRLQLKPGMTGQWQIFGSSRVPLREMVTIDYLYVANWSLWGDLKILGRTIPYVLARRGL